MDFGQTPHNIVYGRRGCIIYYRTRERVISRCYFLYAFHSIYRTFRLFLLSVDSFSRSLFPTLS